MKKETFTFPDYTSLWSFKEKTKAINIRIEIRKNRITGLFNSREIDMALNEFHASNVSYASHNESHYTSNHSSNDIKVNFKNLVNKISTVLKTFNF